MSDIMTPQNPVLPYLRQDRLPPRVRHRVHGQPFRLGAHRVSSTSTRSPSSPASDARGRVVHEP